jgi:hypothetical protein
MPGFYAQWDENIRLANKFSAAQDNLQRSCLPLDTSVKAIVTLSEDGRTTCHIVPAKTRVM